VSYCIIYSSFFTVLGWCAQGCFQYISPDSKLATIVENESHRTNDGRMADMRAEDSNNNPLKDQTHEIMNLQNRHAFGAETTKSSIIKDEPSSSHFSFV
jgi:hypothetical protein